MYSHNYKVLYIVEEQNENKEIPENEIEYLRYKSNDAGGHDIILFNPKEIDSETTDNDVILEVDMVDVLKHLGQQQNASHDNFKETISVTDIQLPIQNITGPIENAMKGKTF